MKPLAHLITMTVLGLAKRNGRKFENPIETSVGGFSLLPKVIALYLKNKDESVPSPALGPFTTNTQIYTQPPATGLRVTWFGHSSLLIEIDAVRILLDPVWDSRAAPLSWAGPKRFFAPCLPLADLPPLDAVIVSHNHYDHLGKQTIRQLSRLAPAAHARWITSLGVGKHLREFGVAHSQIIELDWTQSTTVGSLHITSVPARHFSGRSIWDRLETLWASFVLRGKTHNVYFGADSGLWDGFEPIGREYGPFDLTMLEIGAYNDLWKSIHLGPDGAAQAFQALGASGLLMPMHWGQFQLAPEGWKQPIERLIKLASERGFKLWVPRLGTPTDVIVNQEHLSPWWR